MNFLKAIKLKLYNRLVGHNPIVENKYWAKISIWKRDKTYSKPKALFYLLYLYFSYQKCAKSFNWFNFLPLPESSIWKNFSFEQIAEQIKAHDVISFDAFDTLLFRKFVDPKDVFSLTSQFLGDPSFKKSRIDAEQSLLNNSSYPVYPSIDDIYDAISYNPNISRDFLIKTELQAETASLTCNSFMKSLYDFSLLQNKRVIITSDMYLSSDQIKHLLLNLGFSSPLEVFVSSELGFGKEDGKMQMHISKYFANSKKILHIGDNYIVDFLGSKSAGWDSIFYPNINSIGNRYRPIEMKSIACSLYKSLLNIKFHSSPEIFDKHYEFGYIYAGLIAYGFCKWINDFTKTNGIDFLLFTARDSKIFYDVYSKYFNEKPSCYALCSRASLLRAVFPEHYSLYFDMFFVAKAHKIDPILISQALVEAGLEKLLPLLNACPLADSLLLAEKLKEVDLFLKQNSLLISELYSKNRTAAIDYYSQLIANNKKIAIIDLGWRGTAYSLIKSLLKDKCTGDNKEIVGLIAGAVDSELSNYLIDTNQLFSYMFSHKTNSDIQITSRFLMQLEIVFSAQEPGTEYFDYYNNKPIGFQDSKFIPSNIIINVQNGIIDFCNDYNNWVRNIKFDNCFSGREAFTPINHILSNKKYIIDLFGELFSSDLVSSDYVPLKEILLKLGY